MNTLGLTFLNTAVQAGYLVLALVLVRLIFKQAPKKLLCALWALVGLRLIFPFSLSSVFSLLPSRTPVAASNDVGGVYVQSGLPVIDRTVNTVLQSAAAAPTAPAQAIAEQTAINWGSVLTVVWLCGAALLAVYAVVSYVRLRLQVREAVRTENGVWLCDKISSPFILGVVRPRIYLPSDAAEGDRPLILAHERAHLKRRDQLWKPLGFLLLTLYWFNPVLWVAYVLLCRDIELACDERVLREQGSEIKKAYAEALLRCSAPKHFVRACPVAFGETGVKGRIKSVLNYKKPAFWVIVLALAASAVVAVCFMTVPKEQSTVQLTVVETHTDNKAVQMIPASVTLNGTALQTQVTFVNRSDEEIEVHETEWILRLEDRDLQPLAVADDGWDHTLFFSLKAGKSQSYSYTPSTFCDCTTPGYYRFQAHFRFGSEPEDSFPHAMWFDFKVPTAEEQANAVTLPDGMDNAIHEAILKDNADGYWGGECATEGHVVYGCEQKGSTWKVYLYHGFERYGFINGCFTDVAGHWSCAVLTMQETEDGYVCKKIEYPRDGSENAPSIKRLFPKKLEPRALNPTQSDRDEVSRQCEAQAQAYLKTIGREAAVVPYNRLNLLLPHLTAEVSNKLSNALSELDGLYELTLGTREQLENGVRYVYRTSYLEAQNELLFTKERYDTQEVVESYLADARTGEWLTDRNPMHSRMMQSPSFDAIVTEIRKDSVLMTLTADSGTMKQGTQVEVFLKGTDWENMSVYEGAAYRVIYRDGSLMETYPLQLRDILNIEALDAVTLYLDGTVTKISGKWATVQPLQTQTQRDLPATVRVAVTPTNQSESETPYEGGHYRIHYLAKDVTSEDPLTIDPPQAFYALGDVNTQGNVAVVVPTTGVAEPTSTQWTTSAPPTTTTPPTTARAQTPEEMAAVNRFGEAVRQRFPHLILSTDSWLFSAYEHMNTYEKFQDAVVSDDAVEPRPGYTPKTVTLVTDKGTYIAQFDKDGNFLSDNQ